MVATFKATKVRARMIAMPSPLLNSQSSARLSTRSMLTPISASRKLNATCAETRLVYRNTKFPSTNESSER